ncbi:restriction endonuclease subunit S [Zoogloea sp.]|uniref:restriction endonuclease subunit S n=1 Tax=Zoogloea sp. TaxID=49181 RepID=UPI0026309E6C|nr:restriction endonuclease subunit S [Zoogloea sp.]
MAGKWPYKRVEEIALKIAMGPFGSSIKVETFTDSGIPIISGQHLREAQVTDGEFKFITEAHADSLKNANVQRGDVIFTHAGNIGQVAFIPDDSAYQRYVISQRQFYLRCNTDLMLPEFITYYFKTPEGQHRLLANANQVGVPSIARPSSYLKTIEVPVPSIEEQQVAVWNIKALDAKIRLNIGINQTLEAMAQAIFKSWFVDFDPVKAKLAAIVEGRDPLRAAMSAISGKSESEIDTLPPEQFEQLATTAALFPDEMEQSKLGEIPRGWSASPFGSLLSHTIGGDWGSDSPDSSNDTRVAIIRGTDIPDLDLAQAHRVPFRYTTQKKLASRHLQVGDIVLEVSGGSKDQPTGRSIRIAVNTMREFDCPIEPASFCRLLRPISPEIGVILGLHLVYIYAQGKTWEYQNQSTGIANFQTAHFLDAEFVAKPPTMVAEKFYGLVNPLLERRHDPQSRRLTALRDSLLPKLLSGELSVTEAIAEAEA